MGRDGIRHLLRACRFLFQSTRPVWGATICRIWTTSSRRNFNPRAPCGARHIAEHTRKINLRFQSTRPVWGATLARLILARPIRHFNPRAPCGARPYTMPSPSVLLYFNPRAPCGARPMPPRNCSRLSYFNPRAPCGARRGIRFPAARPQDFNPRAPCGARLFTLKWSTAEVKISIHAPRVGRDSLAPEENTDEEEISIHAPRVGRDSRAGTLMHIYTAFQSTRPVWGATIPNYWENTGRQFQSTRPVWGATICRICLSRVPSNFNPRAPCGARPSVNDGKAYLQNISIHAPRVGRDPAPDLTDEVFDGISIHAPRVGRDQRPHLGDSSHHYFNPRAPCGARPAR